MGTYVRETSFVPAKRKSRMFNISQFIVQQSEKLGDDFVLGVKDVRLAIRKILRLSELDGELRNGDMRAHGDAMGRHGLNLDVYIYRGDRIVHIKPDDLVRLRDRIECWGKHIIHKQRSGTDLIGTLHLDTR